MFINCKLYFFFIYRIRKQNITNVYSIHYALRNLFINELNINQLFIQLKNYIF